MEVAVLQASPLFGLWLAGAQLTAETEPGLAGLLVGSAALTAHVFVVNDWAGYGSDVGDASKCVPADRRIDRAQIAILAAALLVIALLILGMVGRAALGFGAGIAALSTIYSCAPSFGKGTPFAASLNHLVGGALHFLMGYSFVGPVDARGFVLSLFFGLVFAAGHLNQEVRDHAGDAAAGVRTAAVAFGARTAFLTSFGLFTVAYALEFGLALAGELPLIVAVTAVLLWLLQSLWTVQALRRGLDAETALWMRRRYRLLFAVFGAVILAG